MHCSIYVVHLYNKRTNEWTKQKTKDEQRTTEKQSDIKWSNQSKEIKLDEMILVIALSPQGLIKYLTNVYPNISCDSIVYCLWQYLFCKTWEKGSGHQ